MYRALVPALGVGLVMLLVLIPGACGERDHASKLPENPPYREAKRIPAGGYGSDEFRPSMSLRLNDGWQTGPAADFSYGAFMEMPNSLILSRVSESGPTYLEFLVVPKVYEVVSSYEARAHPAPEDMVSWLQDNSYLDAGKPEPTSVGGVSGKQFDAVASRIPQEYLYGGYHGTNTYYVRHSGNVYDDEPCLPLFQTLPGYAEQSTYELCEDYKVRFIILEDVKGKTVTISVLAPTIKFDEAWLDARWVLDTVKWR